MARIWLIMLFLVAGLLPVWAQRGVAEPGYYPIGYNGDIFTGNFVSSGNANEVKLVYKHGSKTESFEGTIQSSCHAPIKDKPSEEKELNLTSVPDGTVLTVFYTPEKIKVDGKKVRTNLVWGLRFDSWNGQKLTNPHRPIILCSHQNSMPFRAFN